MPISALDAKTVQLIRTTQIITSIHAVVKELVENALDADADNIEVNLVDNGTSLIEVKDNGCGISKEDAPCMCLPSCTSKILDFEDLSMIHILSTLRTFGFRGEALNALCAVAEIIIITKIHDDAIGTLYKMNHDGHIMKHESCHRSTGTTVQVRNLFKQIPVRRQIIANTKRANQSIKLLEILMQGFAICKPNVRINLRVNNDLIFTKPSLNNIKEAANHIFGRKIISIMEWVEPKDIEFTLQLMLPSKKIQDLSEISHAGSQYIFVNNRSIKHKDLEKVVNIAILEYFEQESYRKKVIFLVYIILGPTEIDVNLEPNKDVILFKDQNKVLDIIDRCIRKFYGLKSAETIAQDASNDTSAGYENHKLNLNENITKTDWPACKKRKLQVHEKICEEDIVTEKSILINSKDVSKDEDGKTHQNTQQDNEKIYDTHCKDVLDLTSSLQPPNLSDSDSNDAFPAKSSNDMLREQHETLSQLPIVDLGEDFDLIEETEEGKVSKISNKDNSNENNQISLETWSKGHIPGLKGGTNIKSDIAIGKSANNSDSKINTTLEPGKTHVDHKNLKFIKHVRSQIKRENPTLTAVQTAKKITEFWKQLSSEERGYYRDVAQEEEKEWQADKKANEETEANKMDTKKNNNRLLQLFEKMKTAKNEKEEKSNMRTVIPWIIERNKIVTRSDYESGHIIGQLAPNFWVATICNQMWIVNIASLIKGLNVTNTDANKIDAQRIESLLKQWLLEHDDMSIMHSIYEFKKV